MKKSRYSEEQIVRILRETDRDAVVDVAKRTLLSSGYFNSSTRKSRTTVGVGFDLKM